MRKRIAVLLKRLRFIKKSRVLTTFPISETGEFLVGKSLSANKNKRYCLGYYQELRDYDPNRKYDYRYYKMELLQGEYIEHRNYKLSINTRSLIPILWLKKSNLPFIVKTQNKEHQINNIYPKRFYYIKSDSDIELSVNDKIFIGNPVPLKQASRNKKKLVLCLFIDGLSKDIFKFDKFSQIMPNTYSFFKKGIVFNRCYANSEWSLPSLASISTGKYTVNHKIFHRSKPEKISTYNILISEYFKEKDYLTFQVCGNWRRNPSYGYIEGFDRSIYKHSIEASDVVKEFAEHIETFRERDNFIWLTFMDLHHHINGLPTISQQSNMNISDHDYSEGKNKSVFSAKNISKRNRYITELRRLDNYLKIIYEYIEKHYHQDDLLVTLFSDHGQAYLFDETHPLASQRTAVPLMFRGTPIDGTTCDSIVENIDIMPTLLHLSGISYNKEDIDGCIISHFNKSQEKEYAYSESVFSGQTYKAILRDSQNREIKFESKEAVDDNGQINISKENFICLTENISDDVKEKAFIKLLDHLLKSKLMSKTNS